MIKGLCKTGVYMKWVLFGVVVNSFYMLLRAKAATETLSFRWKCSISHRKAEKKN